MKKTFTINISGIIFHIDEDAYEKLGSYLEEIKAGFTGTEGRDEIISDIEARIAEMLHEKIAQGKQVITIDDISEVISVMGEPEQIGAAGQDNAKDSKSGGETKTRKRLYRNPDNKVLGGVCGGAGAYFNIDPLWIRIAFIVALFLLGSGPLLYIILWIIIPEANTTAERLEMKGEPVNIPNIEKSIHEEIEGLKKRLNNLRDEAKSACTKNFRKQYPQTAAEKIVDFFMILLKYFIRTIAVIIGVVFIMVGIFLAIGFISSFISSDDVIWISSMGISNFSIPVFLDLFIVSPGQITLALTGIALVIGIPLLMLIYNGIKLIFGYKSRKRFIGISSFTLWFAGLILCLIVSLSIIRSFAHKEIKEFPDKQFIQPVNSLLKVYINKDNLTDSVVGYETKFVIGQWNLVSANDKSIRFGLPELKIVSSENNKYQLTIYKSSNGADKEDLESRIKNIEYKFVQNDTALILDPFYLLPENEKWRKQVLKIVIKVPLGRMIYLSPETSKILHYNSGVFEFSKDLAGKKWIMTDDGLKEYPSYPVVAGRYPADKTVADSVIK